MPLRKRKKARVGKSVSVDEIARALTEEEIIPGAKLIYDGDDKPWKSKFLRSKGDKAGAYLLPVFEDVGGGREWMDVPGSIMSNYEVMRVETDRTGRVTKAFPGGRPLPDLVIIKSSEYRQHLIGLNPEDVIEKFRLMSLPDAYADPDLTDAEIESREKKLKKWRDEVLSDGW
jgi:hypothetical protein